MKCCGSLSMNGYIKSIIHITKINKGVITNSSNGSVIFNVEYNANIYKLEKNQIVKAVIKSITSFGIYCEDWDAPSGISILFIPSHEIETEEVLNENDVIFLKIEDLRVKKNEYLCVCSMSSSDKY